MSGSLNNRSSYISWKGKTFGQITSTIQKNKNTSTMENSLLFLPPPIKLYRRELKTQSTNNNSKKISTSIDLLDRPGSSLVNFLDICDCSGNKQTLDINLINNRGERGLCCVEDKETSKMFNPENIARRRTRSSGINKRPSTVTTAPYCTTSKEYLSTRGKLFNQNQYHYLKSGDPLIKPGAPGSENNTYSVNNDGNVYCPSNSNYYAPTQFKPNNYKFSQDGAVSSSSRTSRLNYNTITTNGDLYTKAYGSEVGNALSYGASSDAYTIKNKYGVQAPCDTNCIFKI